MLLVIKDVNPDELYSGRLKRLVNAVEPYVVLAAEVQIEGHSQNDRTPVERSEAAFWVTAKGLRMEVFRSVKVKPKEDGRGYQRAGDGERKSEWLESWEDYTGQVWDSFDEALRTWAEAECCSLLHVQITSLYPFPGPRFLEPDPDSHNEP